MKKLILILFCITFLSTPLWAGDDMANLKLQAELYQERILRFELQSQVMQQQYELTKRLLIETQKKLEKEKLEKEKLEREKD